MTFDEIMEFTSANSENFKEMVSALKRETLVPFVGAGMLFPFYPTWNMALEALDKIVAPDRRKAFDEDMKSAVTEIDHCDVLERHIGCPRLCRAINELFDISHFTNSHELRLNERAVTLLPKLFPSAPLLTTNLDKMEEEVFNIYGVPFQAVLSPTDSNILIALKQQRAHGILHLHGYVCGQLTDYDKLVFSKSQYDRHYQPGSALVNGLQDWMENTQLLFLGCSLRNDRSLDILKKVFDNHNRVEHFAILDLKPEDKDYTSRMIQLEDDCGIRAILYPEGQHEAVRIILERLLRETNYAAYTEYRNTLPAKPLVSDENSTDRFRPEAKNTKTIGLKPKLEKLIEFCKAEGDFLWWAITAPGGSGKTRLTMELEDYQKSHGWSVNRLNPSQYIDDEFSKIENNRQPLLVIADYAGENSHTLAHWIERLSTHDGPKIRLLLAEREDNLLITESEEGAPTTVSRNDSQFSTKCDGWYERMKTARVDHRTISRMQYGSPGKFLRLRKLDNTELAEIMQSYAKKVFLGYTLSTSIAKQLCTALETVDPGLCRPLFAMIVVDAYVKNGNPQNWDRNSVLNEIASRETRHIKNQLMERLDITNEDAELSNLVQKLRLHSTILGATKAKDIPEWPDFKASLSIYRQRPGDVLRYLQIIDDSNTTDESDIQIVPIKPDLLGEFYVTEHLSDALPILFSASWYSDVRKVSFIDRMIQDYGDTITKQFWTKLYSCDPQDEFEAASLMNRLFTVSHSTTGQQSHTAVGRMAQIHATYNTTETTYSYSIGLYNLSCELPFPEKKAYVEKIEGLIHSNGTSEIKVALVYAKGLLNLLNASQELSEKKNSALRLKSIYEEFRFDREIALSYAEAIYRLTDCLDLNSRMTYIDELENIYQDNLGDRQFALKLAKCLYNMYRDQFHAGIQPNMEKLRKLCADFKDDYALGFLIDVAELTFNIS